MKCGNVFALTLKTSCKQKTDRYASCKMLRKCLWKRYRSSISSFSLADPPGGPEPGLRRFGQVPRGDLQHTSQIQWRKGVMSLSGQLVTSYCSADHTECGTIDIAASQSVQTTARVVSCITDSVRPRSSDAMCTSESSRRRVCVLWRHSSVPRQIIRCQFWSKEGEGYSRANGHRRRRSPVSGGPNRPWLGSEIVSVVRFWIRGFVNTPKRPEHCADRSCSVTIHCTVSPESRLTKCWWPALLCACIGAMCLAVFAGSKWTPDMHCAQEGEQTVHSKRSMYTRVQYSTCTCIVRVQYVFCSA